MVIFVLEEAHGNGHNQMQDSRAADHVIAPAQVTFKFFTRRASIRAIAAICFVSPLLNISTLPRININMSSVP